MLHLKAHVASSCFKYFRYFICMLQLFHMDIVKVDRDIAYVAMVIHVCCKLLFPMFHLFFQAYVAIVCLFGCCICFTHMLQLFYLGVAYVLHGFHVFLQGF
jgi:hypothetical protein